MEEKAQISAPQTVYNLNGITLLEVKFGRQNTFEPITDAKTVHQKTIINVTHTDLSKPTFTTFLMVEYTVTQINSQEPIMSVSVVQSATFNRGGAPSDKDLKMFANINAPAIIFPFSREIIASLTAKSLLGTVLLHPVNFVQLYEDTLAKEAKK